MAAMLFEGLDKTILKAEVPVRRSKRYLERNGGLNLDNAYGNRYRRCYLNSCSQTFSEGVFQVNSQIVTSFKEPVFPLYLLYSSSWFKISLFGHKCS